MEEDTILNAGSSKDAKKECSKQDLKAEEKLCGIDVKLDNKSKNLSRMEANVTEALTVNAQDQNVQPVEWALEKVKERLQKLKTASLDQTKSSELLEANESSIQLESSLTIEPSPIEEVIEATELQDNWKRFRTLFFEGTIPILKKEQNVEVEDCSITGTFACGIDADKNGHSDQKPTAFLSIVATMEELNDATNCDALKANNFVGGKALEKHSDVEIMEESKQFNESIVCNVQSRRKAKVQLEGSSQGRVAPEARESEAIVPEEDNINMANLLQESNKVLMVSGRLQISPAYDNAEVVQINSSQQTIPAFSNDKIIKLVKEATLTMNYELEKIAEVDKPSSPRQSLEKNSELRTQTETTKSFESEMTQCKKQAELPRWRRNLHKKRLTENVTSTITAPIKAENNNVEAEQIDCRTPAEYQLKSAERIALVRPTELTSDPADRPAPTTCSVPKVPTQVTPAAPKPAADSSLPQQGITHSISTAGSPTRYYTIYIDENTDPLGSTTRRRARTNARSNVIFRVMNCLQNNRDYFFCTFVCIAFLMVAFFLLSFFYELLTITPAPYEIKSPYYPSGAEDMYMPN